MSASVSRTSAPSSSPLREERERGRDLAVSTREGRVGRSGARSGPRPPRGRSRSFDGGPRDLRSQQLLGRSRFGVVCSPGSPNARKTLSHIGPELRQDYPLNLSISISGGKETNQDSPSNGERTGKSPACQSGPSGSELWSGGRCSARSERQVRWKAASQRVTTPWAFGFRASRARSAESGCLGMQL